MSITTQKITPFLWFDKDAEEAINFYTSIFPNSSVKQLKRWPEGGPFPANTIQMAVFELDGLTFNAFDAGPQFQFTEAISFFITCKNQEEVDHYWEKLSGNGGKELMCGWVKDRFGISWQVVPEIVSEKMTSGDPLKLGKMMQALSKMKKLDVLELENAYNQ
jgi:predicted 3-demethylubiquinone-9 3-methyltransferase (glyoxalase superfamily)